MKILEPNSTVEFCVFTTTVALPLYYIKETYTIPSQVSTDVQNRGFKKSRIKMYNKKYNFGSYMCHTNKLIHFKARRRGIPGTYSFSSKEHL